MSPHMTKANNLSVWLRPKITIYSLTAINITRQRRCYSNRPSWEDESNIVHIVGTFTWTDTRLSKQPQTGQLSFDKFSICSTASDTPTDWPEGLWQWQWRSRATRLWLKSAVCKESKRYYITSVLRRQISRVSSNTPCSYLTSVCLIM